MNRKILILTIQFYRPSPWTCRMQTRKFSPFSSSKFLNLLLCILISHRGEREANTREEDSKQILLHPFSDCCVVI